MFDGIFIIVNTSRVRSQVRTIFDRSKKYTDGGGRMHVFYLVRRILGSNDTFVSP
jgi:hypothetical protein